MTKYSQSDLAKSINENHNNIAWNPQHNSWFKLDSCSPVWHKIPESHIHSLILKYLDYS